MASEQMPDDLLRRVVDASPDALVLFTPSGRVVYANDSVEPTFGYPARELVGENIAELLHPDDVGIALASVSAFDEQGVRARTAAIMRFRWPDGSYATLEVNGNPVDAGDGRTLYSMFARRAEDRRLLGETIGALASDAEVPSVLALLFDQWCWGLDHALTSFVWQDADGARHVIGHDLPPELTGLDVEAGADAEAGDPASPWAQAWQGKDVHGATDDLAAPWRDLAQARGLREYRVHPVAHDDGRIGVLVTLWAAGSSHPLPVFENRLLFLARLMELTLRFAERRRLLRHDAEHDALTGLHNRRAFHRAVAEAGDGGQAVLYLDLDGFKPVNDGHGHAVGDLVLAEVGARLRAATAGDGATTVTARLGGDEFAVLAPGLEPDDARALAARLLEAIAAPIEVPGAPDVVVGASIGVALGSGRDGEALLRDADAALYEAKRSGGRRIVVAD